MDTGQMPKSDWRAVDYIEQAMKQLGTLKNQVQDFQ